MPKPINNSNNEAYARLADAVRMYALCVEAWASEVDDSLTSETEPLMRAIATARSHLARQLEVAPTLIKDFDLIQAEAQLKLEPNRPLAIT